MRNIFCKIFLPTLAIALGAASCMDDDSFTQSSAYSLSMSTDTLLLDTTFSTVPTPTKTFWVYNRSGKGLRLSNVRLQRGNQSGFRVNVDGTYLGQQSGFQTSDIEVRNKDSIRVFVELTSPKNGQSTPQLVEDNLLFTLESGLQQKVCLRSWSWDAILLRNLRISSDTTLAQAKPIVVYGGIVVDSLATLTLAEGLNLYFHGDAGITVYGSLKSLGSPSNPVVLRGDRLDHMFDYLPYDRVSGQWQGIKFTASSFDNILQHTDIHSTYNAIALDSSDVSRQKLFLSSSMVHNCQGFGISSNCANLKIENSVVSNTLGNCLEITGGKTLVNSSTFAQFYPFDANRGNALYFSAGTGMDTLDCRNSLFTGYATDVVMRTAPDSAVALPFGFRHCVMRTEKETTADSLRFISVVYEDAEDTTKYGKKHFAVIDEDNLYYDFSLDSTSAAISAADAATATPVDIRGSKRDDAPDCGAYEYQAPAADWPDKQNSKQHIIKSNIKYYTDERNRSTH